MNQDQLAEKLGLKSGKQAISRWERGLAEPSISQLYQIAQILNTTVAELLGEETSTVAEPEIPSNKVLVDKDDYIKILQENTTLKSREIERLRGGDSTTPTSYVIYNRQ